MPSTPPRVPVPRDIWVLVAAAFVIAVGFGLVAPVLPQLATSFGVGATAASVIVSAFALSRLVLAPAAGSLVDRLGERPVYVTGLLLVAASSAACAFAPDYWTLLAVRGLGGIGSTMFTISASGLIVRLAPPEARGRVSGLYAASFLMGSIAGPVIGGLLAGFGLRVPFLVYAAALIVAAAVVQALLGRGGATGARTTAAARPPLLLAEALRAAQYRAAVGSNFANGWAAFGIRMALVPLFASAALGAGPQAAGLALALYAVGTAAALTFTGRLADRWGRRPVAVIGLMWTAVPTALLGVSGSEPVFFALSIAAGFGAGFLGPSLQATVADTIGSDRSGGRPLAVFQMASDVGSILGPLVAGALADGIGYGWAFAVSGGCLLAAVPLWARRSVPSPRGQLPLRESDLS
ncbi:MFS transporter [Sinomonas cyclohexanicum]|uniref:MFS transporter n=1 Tax=Sinomonas cyclohexanicum TaxID=322009 RepID=A0ABM7PW75_SINCY|nr:MFS transporter [Corynebacterium cyclohexanicum]BCT76544.1 MFS transporter [Corynebacterium cyclohexanicum]